nr:reverse transcriptase domain-containing protein [Tanacetum cinerariifolium]
RIGPVAYRHRLPKELNGVHDPTLQVPLDEIQVDARLNFVKEPVEILEREFKKLKRSRIAIVKKGKLAPRFVGPFEITERIEPVEILEREFKKLKRSRIAIVKILYRVNGGEFMGFAMIYGLL